LQLLLRYADWRIFLNAIDKARESCKTSGEVVSDHFVDINKMIMVVSSASTTGISPLPEVLEGNTTIKELV